MMVPSQIQCCALPIMRFYGNFTFKDSVTKKVNAFNPDLWCIGFIVRVCLQRYIARLVCIHGQ